MKQSKQLLQIVFTVLALSSINAFGVEADSNSRIGEARRVEDPNEFKVCADQDGLPYSNDKLEGFENKIAEVIAADLGKKLSYMFWYDRQGFLRNTLNANKCDVVMSTTSDYDALLTTKPYYRTGYVFAYRKDSGLNITSWDSPDLKKSYIGVVGQTPPSIPLNDNNLIGNSRPYRLQRDLNFGPGYIMDDLIKGDIQVAILWGPIAGFYAKQAMVKSGVDIVINPVPEYELTNPKGKQYWNLSIGVRKKDKERMAMIQGALDRNQDKIFKIMDDFGVPHFPVVEGDSIQKVYNKSINKKSEATEKRGDAIPKAE